MYDFSPIRTGNANLVVQCAEIAHTSAAEIKKVLKERFSQYTHNYQVGAKFNQLRIQPGQWEAAN